ncbi:hypothetical protein N7456_007269 [Penicillium angulare]|uniref:Metallo-beta-lactamase domain-containing protein n=1 Tax=Penicillium angulare TaxID=116970 RepID=A0A9W9FJD0_9EURO|nr:hypothetical protein N7456_007269 [Penicillium angulare]
MAETSDPAAWIANAAIPAFKCPMGTKMYILDLGTLQVDDSWLLRGTNTSSVRNLNPENRRRDLMVLAALIEYPGVGLILFETRYAEDIELGAPITDIFPRTEYREEQRLPAAIEATGNNIKDVKVVIIGHLHLDHTGGLEHFIGTDIPIYAHEAELKHTCWAVGTGADFGVYIGHYIDLEKLNWQTFDESTLDLFQGISIHHLPGHTLGLCGLQINLKKDGTFIWTTDQFHIRENYEIGHPHVGLARDHNFWYRSLRLVQRLQRIFDAKLIFGHDKDVGMGYKLAKEYYE